MEIVRRLPRNASTSAHPFDIYGQIGISLTRLYAGTHIWTGIYNTKKFSQFGAKDFTLTIKRSNQNLRTCPPPFVLITRGVHIVMNAFANNARVRKTHFH